MKRTTLTAVLAASACVGDSPAADTDAASSNSTKSSSTEVRRRPRVLRDGCEDEAVATAQRRSLEPNRLYPSTMTETASARISWRERPSCMLFVFSAHQWSIGTSTVRRFCFT